MSIPRLLPIPSFWQYWLSYIWPQHVEDFEQDNGAKLEVYLRSGYYQLAYGRVFYSDGLAYRPFRLGLARIGSEALARIGRVLFLGAGMGSGAHILQKKYPRTRNADFVDTNRLILRLCSESVASCHGLSPRFHHNDAAAFVQGSTDTYDLIAVDVFEESKVPEAILTQPFMESCKACMAKDAWLLINLIFDSDREWISYYQQLSRIFVIEYILNVRGNRVIVAHI